MRGKATQAPGTFYALLMGIRYVWFLLKKPPSFLFIFMTVDFSESRPPVLQNVPHSGCYVFANDWV